MLATFPTEAMELALKWFYVTLIVTFALTLITARSFSERKTVVPCILIVPFALTLAYACFARYRLMFGVVDTIWARTFPYPDAILDQMIASRAALPEDIPPNSIDINGGYAETFYTVACIAIVAAAVLGWAIGMATRPRMAR